MQDSLRNFKAEFFKAFSHSARIKTLELIRAGELSVTDLHDPLGN
jgi:DNA-binding transcriptional ArsR family regulator